MRSLVALSHQQYLSVLSRCPLTLSSKQKAAVSPSSDPTPLSPSPSLSPALPHWSRTGTNASLYRQLGTGGTYLPTRSFREIRTWSFCKRKHYAYHEKCTIFRHRVEKQVPIVKGGGNETSGWCKSDATLSALDLLPVPRTKPVQAPLHCPKLRDISDPLHPYWGSRWYFCKEVSRTTCRM